MILLRVLCLLFCVIASTNHATQDSGYFATWWGDEPLTSVAPEKAGLSSGRLDLLKRRMQDFVDDGKLSGIVTMLARHGKLVHQEAYGYQDIEAKIPMAKDSIFRIYSMTKPITAVAMMILYEEGRFNLSDPIERYLPEFKDMKVYAGESESGPIYEDAQHPITIRELMTHTAGFVYGYTDDSPVDQMYRDVKILDRNSTLKEMAEKLAKLPLRYQPGTQWHYSVAVDLQGYLVEVLSGQSLDRFFKERIFDPLGMPDSAFFVAEDKIGRFAQIYHYAEDASLQVGWDIEDDKDWLKQPALLSGGAGLLSTAKDYMRFCQMLLNEGELDGVRILSPTTVRFMRQDQLPLAARTGSLTFTPERSIPGMGFNLGFAVVTDNVEAETPSLGAYSWGGAAGTWFWIDPTEDLVFVGMIQHARGTPKRPPLRVLSRRLVYPAIIE